MSENANLPSWLGGIAGTLGALWLIFKHIFSFVTRDELRNALAEIRNEQQRMHGENRETLDRIHERVDDMWKRVP